jgi:hypothetical protein
MSPVTSVLMWRWYRYWKFMSYQFSCLLHPVAMKSSSLIFPFCLTLYNTITLNSICHEAAKVIQFNTILMGWQWHWMVQMHRCFCDLLCLHKQGSDIGTWMMEMKSLDVFELPGMPAECWWWRHIFDVLTSYSSFRWGAAGEKCDVTV